jgi:hypothetical protein
MSFDAKFDTLASVGCHFHRLKVEASHWSTLKLKASTIMAVRRRIRALDSITVVRLLTEK